MGIRKLLIVFLGCLWITTGWAQTQQLKRVSAHLLTQTLQNGQVTKAEADLHLEFPSGQILLHNYYPEDFIFISNPLGEARLYKPKENKMIIKANEVLTSRNNNLYYFLINQTYDLGFKDLGFTIIDSKNDDDAFVTTWQAPVHLLDQVNKIELVHKNMIPIYAEYSSTKGDIILKVFFDEFVQVYDSQVPALITEIVFFPEGDSLIKRMKYSDYRYGAQCDPDDFKLTIPDDVQIIK